ncbi:hypothetical protein NPIL_326971 [Nephila pilipes]|uniref:Uncharacterized protein n=1 Tax=Nephila pilipes TaxID=299642 RepID=A0A8X6PFE8_NEPPI|nr:hypothetical protein NPIL_326971 [Nephila pilipes]
MEARRFKYRPRSMVRHQNPSTTNETKRNMLLCDSDDDEDIVLDESDTDDEEHISEREDVSESERVQQAIQKMKIMTID